MKFSLNLAAMASVMALVTLSNAALAEIVTTGQISQTGWRLVDLDANDGITPGITFTDVSSRSGAMLGDGRTGGYFSDFNTAAGGDPVSAAIAHLNSGSTSRFENGVMASTGTLNDAGWISTSQSWDAWFVLTPHTRLEYFGAASGNAINDGRDVPTDGAFKHMYTIVSANVTPNGQQGGSGVGDDPFNHYFGSVGVGSLAGNNTLSDNFVLNYVNNDGTDLIGKLELSTYVYGSMPVPAVPEPETYAMMLGGIAVLGALARRRKMQKLA